MVRSCEWFEWPSLYSSIRGCAVPKELIWHQMNLQKVGFQFLDQCGNIGKVLILNSDDSNSHFVDQMISQIIIVHLIFVYLSVNFNDYFFLCTVKIADEKTFLSHKIQLYGMLAEEFFTEEFTIADNFPEGPFAFGLVLPQASGGAFNNDIHLTEYYVLIF